MIATIVALPLAVAKGLKSAPCGYQRTPYYAHTGAAPLLLNCVRAEASKGTERDSLLEGDGFELPVPQGRPDKQRRQSSTQFLWLSDQA